MLIAATLLLTSLLGVNAQWEPQWPYWSIVQLFNNTNCSGPSVKNLTLSSEKVADGTFCSRLDTDFSAYNISSAVVTNSNLGPGNTSVTLCTANCKSEMVNITLDQGCVAAPIEALMFFWYT